MIRASVLAAVVCLALAAPAAAHTLTLAGAAHAAKRFADDLAAKVSPAPAVVVRRCDRRTRHVVDCVVRLRFSTAVCERAVRVRFTSAYTRSVARRFIGPAACF